MTRPKSRTVVIPEQPRIHSYDSSALTVFARNNHRCRQLTGRSMDTIWSKLVVQSIFESLTAQG